MSSYRFGFLNLRSEQKFAGGRITPLDRFDDAKNWVAEYAHRDGFLYPPTVESRTAEGETISHSERPAHLYPGFASHELRFDSDMPGADPSRLDASLLIHLAAFLRETRVQFEDWWLDSRVQLSRRFLPMSNAVAEHFLSHAYERWQTWSLKARIQFTNILFMFNLAPAYEWDWEHFAIEYMVFDACYKNATELELSLPVNGHAARIDGLCRAFGIQENAILSSELVQLRNGLFHEALWDKGQPGAAGSGKAFMGQFHLRRLNQRLILANLGYENEFMRSAWWTMGAFYFGLPGQVL